LDLILPLSFFPWLECIDSPDYDRSAFFFQCKEGGGTAKEKELALGPFLAYFY
jgi:hypothetical protein